jgi:hemolysin activation/secretion protein
LNPAITINNVTGFGESTSISGTFSAGLQYGRAAITVPVGLWGTRIGGAYSALTYKLRGDFKDLQSHGDAYVTSAYVLQPLVRSRNFNLYANLEYDFREFEDRIDLFGSREKKDADVAILSLTGDMRDNLLGGGLTGLTVSLYAGNLDIKTPEFRDVDSITAQTNGSYYKGLLNVWRQQNLIGDLSGYLAYTQQLASKNLDSSEDFILGGPYGVRSYPQGEAPADEAYLMTAELRYNLNRLLMQKAGNLELIGFIDYGKAHINKFLWDGADPNNTRYLSGSGLGLNWTLKYFFLKASYAWKLGHEEATSASDHSGYGWLQMMAWF